TFDESFMYFIMGMPGRDSIPLFKSHFDLNDSLEDIGNDYRHYFMESCNGGLIEFRPRAHDLIIKMHNAAVPMAIATSSRRVHVDSVFGPHSLMDRFRHICTADDVMHGKPSPEIYILAATRLGVEPHELLVFEDSPIGVTAAKAAGCVCVAVP